MGDSNYFLFWTGCHIYTICLYWQTSSINHVQRRWHANLDLYLLWRSSHPHPTLLPSVLKSDIYQEKDRPIKILLRYSFPLYLWIGRTDRKNYADVEKVCRTSDPVPVCRREDSGDFRRKCSGSPENFRRKTGFPPEFCDFRRKYAIAAGNPGSDGPPEKFTMQSGPDQ